MDKNTYETYEFLPASNNVADTNQFVVVQDDGTFLLNRQIQYVAQVQNVKEVLEDVQPCTVYGVSSQQFFVDVDNPGELISVSDPFILPEGENSLYTNSYLLQPSSSNTTEQMEDVVVDQFKQPNTQDVDIDVVTHNNKQGNNFTEITLSDDQYRTLEQKGWILLESNDKIFVLNTLGLHDITSNDKLIQKLRNEIHNSSSDGNAMPENFSSQFSNIVEETEPLSDQQEMVNFVISNDEKTENIESIQFVVDNKENVQETFGKVQVWNSSETEPEMETDAKECKLQQFTEGAKQIQLNETNSIKIKTKFNFKDIPDKIVFGKSVNGKRLVAKVSRKVNNKIEDLLACQEVADPQNTPALVNEAEFISLIQERLQVGLQTKVNKEDITSAQMVVSQLMKVPNVKQALIGQNLVVTKTSNRKDEFGIIYNNGNPTLVTGRVTTRQESSSFKHLPNLLQTIRTKTEKQNAARSKQHEAYSSIEEKEGKENITLFHIHITETKCTGNLVRVAVNLNKRIVPDKIILETSIKNTKVTKPESHTINDNITYKDLDDPQNSNSATGLNDSEFIGLMQERLQVGLNIKVTFEDIASAEMVISHLMKVPNLYQALIGHDLIVTKNSNIKDEFGVIYDRSKASIVTGRVTEENKSKVFEHLPNLLQTIKARSEAVARGNETYSCIEEKAAKENVTLFHVHITETKCTDNVVRVSVTLKKRQIPINMIFTTKKRYPSPVFACSSCAALFQSEETLREHQESQCMDTEDIDMLTIESDNLNKTDDDMLILKNGKEKIYSCTQCDTSFTKLSNMQRHIKTHRRVINNTQEDTSQDGTEKEQTNEIIYKCKMCPSTYYHSASLSKHIVTRHIKIKSN